MGFALWIDGDLAWAEGTHEYRPWGSAVIAVTDLFRLRDFSPTRRTRTRAGSSYTGLFASIEDVNFFLRRHRVRLSETAAPRDTSQVT